MLSTKMGYTRGWGSAQVEKIFLNIININYTKVDKPACILSKTILCLLVEYPTWWTWSMGPFIAVAIVMAVATAVLFIRLGCSVFWVLDWCSGLWEENK